MDTSKKLFTMSHPSGWPIEGGASDSNHVPPLRGGLSKEEHPILRSCFDFVMENRCFFLGGEKSVPEARHLINPIPSEARYGGQRALRYSVLKGRHSPKDR